MERSLDVPTLIKEGQRLLSQDDEKGAHERFLEAGQELYDRHRNRMLAKCTWRFGDAGKDLVQEVFQLLWEKMPELEHPETVEGWLYGVRDNKMLQMGRNVGRRKSIEEEKQGPIAESVHRAPVEPPEKLVMRREEDQEHQDALGRLSQALEQLDPEDVTLLRMRFHLGLSFADIGAALGVGEATVRRRLKNILGNLNDGLQGGRRAS